MSVITKAIAAKRFVRRVFRGMLFLALAFTSAHAQSPTDNGTPLGLAPGSPEGSYALSGFENVNLYSGGLSFSLPALQIGGRGHAGYSVQVPIESKWIVTKDESYDENNNLLTSLTPWSSPSGGGGYGPGTVSVRYSQWKPETCTIGVQQFTTHRWASVAIVFRAPDGTEHELVDQGTMGQPTSYPSCSLNGTFRGPVFVSKDQPGMTFISDAAIREAPYYGNGRITGYLKMPDGTVYRVDAIDHNFQYWSYSTVVISWIRDANGNKTSFTYTNSGYADVLTTIKDSLNRQITIEYGVNEAPYGLCDRLTYKGYGGGNRVIHISSGNLSAALRSGSTIKTYKQLFPELDGAEDPFDPLVLTSIWLPDGDGVTRRYRFFYNSYGELARVELPTGGAIEYDWSSGLATGAADGLLYAVPGLAHWTEFDPSLPQVYRRLINRRAVDVGNVLLGSTSYSRPETQNGDFSITNLGYVAATHYDANGNPMSVDNHFFYGSVASSFFSWQATPQFMPTYSPFASYKDGHEYQTDYYAANGQTLLRREIQSWDQFPVSWWSGSADSAPTNSPFVKETATTLADTGQVMKSTHINPQTGQIMIDQYGNPLDVWMYDYGQGAPGPLLRHMHTEFLTVNPVNSIDYTNRTSASGPHMFSLPTRMSVYDSSETERARTTMEYDNYVTDAGHAGLTPRTSISGLDSSYTTGYLTRGNATATSRFFLVGGSPTGSVTGYVQYDVAGNAVKTIDARGNPTLFTFADCFGTPDGDAHIPAAPIELSSVSQFSYAFATVVQNAMGHTIYTQFDYYLGKPVDSEDPNGTTSSGFYNDVLDRPTQVISAANRATSLKRKSLFTYDDVGRSTTTTSDFNSYAETSPLKTKNFFDGMGRTIETHTYEGGSNYIAVQQRYDALGRVFQTSNPFRNGETPVWTTTTFDELSRVRFVTTPDNAVAGTSYTGNTATATDQNGKERKSVSDAFGRLVKVYEDPNGVNWLTNYTYDTLDNLTGVSQYDSVSGVTQTRTFTYDSLKRLLTALNPENGTVSYVYDAQGNVLVLTDARGVSRHFSYDGINRLTRRWYNGGSSTSNTVNNVPALPAPVAASDEVTMVYDSQPLPSGAPPAFQRGSATGRLVAMNYGTGSSAGDYFSYDELGRAVLKVQQTGGVNYPITMTYNNGGALLSLTYPSLHFVNYNYDQAGRPGDKDAQHLAMTGNLGEGGSQRTYSQGILYTALGGMSKEQFGTDTPIYNKLFYNVRGQLSEIRDSTTSATDTSWNRGAIINHYSNNCWGMCGGTGSTTPMTDNNGNLKKQEVYVPFDDQITGSDNFAQFYEYDSVNRVSSVRENKFGGPTLWQQAYTYDRFGNRTINQGGTYGGVPNLPFSVDPVTNRLGLAPGGRGVIGYDSAGNLTNDTYSGQGQRDYDAENRMTQAWAGGQWQIYTYDGTGQRVRRNANNQITWQVYGVGGELLAEYAANAPAATPKKEYGYRSGQLLITAELAPPSQTNVASAANGGVATASSTLNASFPASSTNNSDRKGLNWGSGGGWRDAEPGNTFSDWVQVDFNGSKTISEIDVFTIQDNYSSPVEPTETLTFSTYGLTGYDVQYWNGTAWATVPGGSITGNNKVWRKVSFSPIATTKIRVLTNASVDGYSRLVELEAWSTGATSQNVTWTNVSSTIQVTGNSIQKISGTNAWDAAASSSQTIAGGDGSMEFTPGETQTWRMCGLSTSGWSGWYGDLKYAIFIDGGSNLSIYESGTSRGTFGTYAAGDRLKVAIETGVVKYYRNSTLLYTSTVAPQYPLLVAASLNTVGSGVYNVVLNSSAPAGWSLNWLVGDHLGTPRMVFDKSGTLASTKRHDYLPFGEELTTQSQRTAQLGYAADTVRQKFTGYERDSETQLDYAHARYYASFQGRFAGVDRVSGSPADPQSWDGYSYTHNNPLNLTDPTGLYASAEYAYDPGREFDPYLWESRQRRVTTDAMERALAAYQQMVDQGLANLKLKQEEKKQQEQLASSSASVKVNGQTVTVTVEQNNQPAAFTHKEIKGVKSTGVGVTLTVTVTDGNGRALEGASATETVTALAGKPIRQNADPVPLDGQGRGKDWVTNSAPDPKNEAEFNAIKKMVTSEFITTQEFKLTVTLKSGSVIEVIQVRTLTNMTQGKLNAVDPALGTPAYTYRQEKMKIRVVKR